MCVSVLFVQYERCCEGKGHGVVYTNKSVRLSDVLLSSIKYIVSWLCCFICKMLQTLVV